MSLGIVFKGTEGIVLAADSRVTLMATLPDLAPQNPGVQQVVVVPAIWRLKHESSDPLGVLLVQLNLISYPT
jgi:hypothetical protein